MITLLIRWYKYMNCDNFFVRSQKPEAQKWDFYLISQHRRQEVHQNIVLPWKLQAEWPGKKEVISLQLNLKCISLRGCKFIRQKALEFDTSTNYMVFQSLFDIMQWKSNRKRSVNLLYGLHYHNLELVRNLIHETGDLLHQSVNAAFVSSLQTVSLLTFNYTVKQNKNKIKLFKIPLTIEIHKGHLLQ